VFNSPFSEAQRASQKAAEQGQAEFIRQLQPKPTLQDEAAVEYINKNLKLKTDLDLVSRQLTEAQSKWGKGQEKNEDLDVFSIVENKEDSSGENQESSEGVVDIDVDLISSIAENMKDVIS